jgi:hypothetical protein
MLCLFAFLLAGPALAQQAPIPLVPQTTQPFPQVTGPQSGQIQVRELGSLDADAIGVLDPSHGGFGPDMWADSNMAVVQKVLPLLPAAGGSLTVHQLERRLLLSTAAVPAGRGAGEPLIRLRAAKLLAIGELDGLNALLKAVPSPAVTPELRRLRADAALMAGDTAAACEQVMPLKAAAPDDPFPTQLQAFCQFAAGKPREAGLLVDLLREEKVADPAFFAAADALDGVKPGRIDGLANLSALDLAMARAARLALPESVVAGNPPPAILRTVALLPDATLEARLTAAEKAEAAGALDTEALRQLYQSVRFTPQELANPPAAATPRGRALAFQAAEGQSDAAAKADLIAKALAQAQGLSYFTAARLYAPDIAGLAPAPALAWFATLAARALYAAQMPRQASPWVGLAPADRAAALWPLARLAGQDDRPPTAALLAEWKRAQGAGDVRRDTVVLSLFAAVGETLPGEAWLPLFDGPALVTAPVPRPALWQGLRVATENLRLGETVLMALASLGEESLAQADPTTLYRVAAALRAVGLNADARALAEEAAIANGL